MSESGEPKWLVWARELQAIAQTGLAFTKDPYDQERYQALRRLAAVIVAEHSDVPADRIEGIFTGEAGYATPKIDVRGAVFDPAGRMLLVRERMDHGRWTLPGGWADVNQTAAECAVREVYEESGYHVVATKLAAVWDRVRQGHPASHGFSLYKLVFLCRLVGGEAQTSLETSEVAFFAEDEVPAELSLGRILPGQIQRLFAHARDPALPTDFD